MHMADALLSTPVALVMVGLSAAALAGAGRSLRRQPDDRRVPLMGVLGAFVFSLLQLFFQWDAVFGNFAKHWQLMMGATIIACVAFMPDGLIGLRAQVSAWRHRRRAAQRKAAHV